MGGNGVAVRILITGGRGQLGRALEAALSGHDCRADGHPELDITDTGAVAEAFEAFGPDAVVHAAAWTDTAGCEADPDRALLVNGEGTRIVAEACSRSGGVMLYVSTNEVFDGEKREPYGEDDEPNPLNAYARSKLVGEQHVRTLLDRFYVVRTAWLYGEGRTSFPEKVVQAAERGGPLRGVTDEIATPTWTADLAGAIAQLLRGAPLGTYHLTDGGEASRLDWMREVLRLRGIDREVQPATQADFDLPYRKPVYSVLSLEKARRAGIDMPPWEDSLGRCLGAAG